MNNYVYFEEILSSVSDETGITILKNREPSIRRMIADAEFEINPYSSLYVKKRMIFYKGNGNFDGLKIKKPEDFVSLSSVGDCLEPICKKCTFETKSHIILCDSIDRPKIIMTYFSLQYDSNGNPIVHRNHKAAVVAYIVWKLYTPKVFMGIGNRGVKNELEFEFEMRCGEARGEDFMEGDGLKQMVRINQMSMKELDTICIDTCDASNCIPQYSDEMIKDNNNDDDLLKKVYYWQYNEVKFVPKGVNDFDEEFLSTKQHISWEQADVGFTFSFPYVGRIAFGIEGVENPLEIKLMDITGNYVAENIFHRIYNPITKLLILEWDDYLNGSIYIKFEKQ